MHKIVWLKFSNLLAVKVFRVDTKIIRGVAASEGIVQIANEIGADLIIMGSHGRTGVKKMMLGSVAQNVLTQSPVPFWLLRFNSVLTVLCPSKRQNKKIPFASERDFSG